MTALDDGELYEKYADELIRFATALVGPSGAEDLLSTVYVRALASPTWPSVTNKRAYLFRALTNEARTRHRSTQRRLAREARATTSSAVDGVPADVDVLRALRGLTVRQRAAIWMAYWLDAPPSEIARMLSTPQRTVERELQRARAQLERDLG